MLRPASVLACVVLLGRGLACGEQANDEGFRPLFNGKDLSGWVLVNTPPATWKVADGMLVCSGKPIGEIRTEQMYQNFILEVEWRHLHPKGNAGIFVWADDITARGVPFHRSVEVQVLENAYGNTESHTTHGDIFPIHGAKMTPINGRGGDRAFPTEERSKPSPEWNHYRIECQDGEISLAVNGKVVTRGKDASPRKGYICLESEGGVVHYRNLRIKELPETPMDPEHVAIAHRGYRSLYTGLDLEGWKGTPESSKHWHPQDWVLAYDGKAAAGEVGLSTTESFADCSFVVDVRLPGESTVTIQLRNSKPGGFTLGPGDADLRQHLSQAGQWNRCEGSVRENRLTLKLNGETVVRNRQLDGAAAPLTIIPQGAADFANLYVGPWRELP